MATLDWLLVSENWIVVLATYLFALGLLSSLTWVFFSRLEAHLVRREYWPPQFSLFKKFFVPTLIFLISLFLGFLPTAVEVPPKASEVLLTAAKLGTILSTMIILLKVINMVVWAYTRRLRIDQPDNLRQRRLKTQVQYLEKILDLAVVFFALTSIMLSFENFRRFGGSLLASAGLASVILGFSAQRSLGNLIAGFQIAFTQPIRLGDAVLVENEWGEIEEITLTYVVVRIWDWRRLILPITYFLEKPFQNWTRTSSELIGSVFLYVDYSVPVEAVRQELIRILDQSKLWNRGVVSLQVTDATDKTICLRALMSARSSPVAFDLRCEVREALIAFIQKNYPHALPRTRFEGDHI